MREIKFRAWDKVENTMCYFDNPHWTLDTLKLMFGGSGLHVYNLQNGSGGDDYELMQCTGLKDKNGKEIYEGDIIKVHFGKWVEYEEAWNGYDTYGKEIVKREEKDYVGEVRWRVVGGVGFVVGELNNRWFRFNKRKTGEGTEVIGNIYENPELLGDRLRELKK